ncbi:MAG TPA: NACHT domain-containing protein, partial [Anaerolineales bacterium]|nr:NACHT domain-containing protein [Anaerolineales bacterium]
MLTFVAPELIPSLLPQAWVPAWKSAPLLVRWVPIWLSASLIAFGLWSNWEQVSSGQLVGKLMGKPAQPVHSSPPLPAIPDYERDRLSALTERVWVKGILANSLHAKFIAPQLASRHADFIESSIPFHYKNKAYEQGKILSLFDELHGRLLISGEPGSGKSTLLLTLAEKLLAHPSPKRPTPVVMRLSGWDGKHPLLDWLADELVYSNGCTRPMAQSWLKSGELTLLLDGLDEIADLTTRQAGVAQIKELTEHYPHRVVVTCRTAQLQETKLKLALQEALEIQAFDDDKIRAYLAPQNIAMPQGDLLEWVRKPLFLSLYARVSHAQPGSLLSTHNLIRKSVVELYQRPRANTTSKPLQRWDVRRSVQVLAWLGRNLERQGKTSFRVEDLGGYWFPGRRQGIGLSLVWGLIFGLNAGPSVGLIAGPSMGLIFGLIVGLFGGVVHSSPVDAVRWDFGKLFSRTMWHALQNDLIFSLILSLSAGLIAGLIAGLMTSLMLGLVLVLPEIPEPIALREIHPRTGLANALRAGAQTAFAVWLWLALPVTLVWAFQPHGLANWAQTFKFSINSFFIGWLSFAAFFAYLATWRNGWGTVQTQLAVRLYA